MLAVWNQRYEPVANNLALSALVAALPVIVLLGLLGLVRIRAHYAALAGLATAFLVALLVYGMPAGSGAPRRGAVADRHRVGQRGALQRPRPLRGRPLRRRGPPRAGLVHLCTALVH